MNYFSIKDIERMSGIKAHTLRIWEQRYGLSFCKRKESLHRYFDNEDLKEILGVAHLYRLGFKISRIATLSKEEIRAIAYKNATAELIHDYVDQMISASLDYDELSFEKIIDQAIGRLGFADTVRSVFYPLLEKIGLLWLTGHVIPAQEHFTSHLILKKLLLETERLALPSEDRPARVVIFSPEGETHELPLLVTRYLLRKEGIHTVYFGPNVRLEHIARYAANKKVTHICCNMITNFQDFEPDTYLQHLSDQFPTQRIFASGRSFDDLMETPANVAILTTLEDCWNIAKLVIAGARR